MLFKNNTKLVKFVLPQQLSVCSAAIHNDEWTERSRTTVTPIAAQKESPHTFPKIISSFITLLAINTEPLLTTRV